MGNISKNFQSHQPPNLPQLHKVLLKTMTPTTNTKFFLHRYSDGQDPKDLTKISSPRSDRGRILLLVILGATLMCSCQATCQKCNRKMGFSYLKTAVEWREQIEQKIGRSGHEACEPFFVNYAYENGRICESLWHQPCKYYTKEAKICQQCFRSICVTTDAGTPDKQFDMRCVRLDAEKLYERGKKLRTRADQKDIKEAIKTYKIFKQFHERFNERDGKLERSLAVAYPRC